MSEIKIENGGLYWWPVTSNVQMFIPFAEIESVQIRLKNGGVVAMPITVESPEDTKAAKKP